MKHDDISIPAAYIFVLSVLWCSFVVGIACLYNVSKLLIISSKDVEMNPGPVIYKICPGCENNVVHIKKKMCPCGHVFGKNLARVVRQGYCYYSYIINQCWLTVAEGTVIDSTINIKSIDTVVENIITINKRTDTMINNTDTVVDASDVKSTTIDDNVIDSSGWDS